MAEDTASLNVPGNLAQPFKWDHWIFPPEDRPANPVWGVENGIAVGLWPTVGPRGLLRIYTPYLDQAFPRMINFIAVEPVMSGARGFSELESSELDGVPGKRMWASNDLDDAARPRRPWDCVSGTQIVIDGTRALTVFIHMESFSSGVQPIIQITFRQDRPLEVGLRTFLARTSALADECILSATMGNYARLRLLWLKGERLCSKDLWKDAEPNDMGFFPSLAWPLSRILQVNGEAIAAATSDEADPRKALYGQDVHPAWHYIGRTATQYWRKPSPSKDLKVRVNARRTYWPWPDKGVIPGGISFENFEMSEPYSPGAEYWFGVTPHSPASLGFGDA